MISRYTYFMMILNVTKLLRLRTTKGLYIGITTTRYNNFQSFKLKFYGVKLTYAKQGLTLH